MDTILDMTKVFLSSVCLVYFQQMLHGTICFLLFASGNYIGILFWKNCAGHRHNGCNFFMIQCNGQCSTACVWISSEDKIEERIPFDLCL